MSFKVKRSRPCLQRRRRRAPLSVVCSARAWRHEETASQRRAPNTSPNANALPPCHTESAVRGFRSHKPALWRMGQRTLRSRSSSIAAYWELYRHRRGFFAQTTLIILRRVIRICLRADIVHQFSAYTSLPINFHVVDMRQTTLQRITNLSSTRTSTVESLTLPVCLVRWRRRLLSISVWVSFAVDQPITSHDSRHCLVLLANMTPL